MAPDRRLTVSRARQAAIGAVIALVLVTGAVVYRSRLPRDASVSHSVADVFKRPGTTVFAYQWTRAGLPVATEIVSAHAGSDGHCGWQSATLLNLYLGSDAPPPHRAQFVRDPRGVIKAENAARLQLRGVLPPDARDTGYRTRGVELWLARDMKAAYLVNGATREDVERWHRNPEQTGCD